MVVVMYEQRETIKRIINFDIIMKCSVKYTMSHAKIDINFSKN